MPRRFGASAADLSRRALESLAADEYRNGHLTKPELQRLLGVETSFQLDGFFKAHNIYEGYTLDEIRRQVETLERLGF